MDGFALFSGERTLHQEGENKSKHFRQSQIFTDLLNSNMPWYVVSPELNSQLTRMGLGCRICVRSIQSITMPFIFITCRMNYGKAARWLCSETQKLIYIDSDIFRFSFLFTQSSIQRIDLKWNLYGFLCWCVSYPIHTLCSKSIYGIILKKIYAHIDFDTVCVVFCRRSALSIKFFSWEITWLYTFAIITRQLLSTYFESKI